MSMRLSSALLWVAGGTLALAAQGATFGTVVPIAGHAAELALDESRGVLYIANYTADRIDVLSLATNTVERRLFPGAQPFGLALSPDSRYLVVTHYGPFTTSPPNNRLTVIDLTNNQRRSYAMAAPPLGVAFGYDGQALVVTAADFQLFDPATGASLLLNTLDGMAGQTLPVDLTTLPAEITRASVTASADGQRIYGVAGDVDAVVLFSYNVMYRRLQALGFTTSPNLGPRVVSVAQDGSYFLAGWGLFGCDFRLHGDCDASGPLAAQFRHAAGDLGWGGHAIDQRAGLIYAQMPPATAGAEPLNLMVADADNLTVRERLRISENLTGRAVLNRDGSVLYAISDSGVTVFPVGQLGRLPRLAASREDLLFQGQFCNRGQLTQDVQVVNLGGGSADYSARVCDGAVPDTCNAVAGVRVLPAGTGTLRVEVDGTVLQNYTGTQVHRLEIASRAAINYPADLTGVSAGSQVAARVRLLINSREPDQRGSVVNVPGRLVDLLADPLRNRFYVLRQDRNQVLVFDGGTYQQIATLRTSNTPTHLSLTFDRQNLLVGHDDSQLAYVFDLNTLEPQPPIRFPYGHYPRSLAASARALLGACRVAGPVHTIDRADFLSRTASPLASLGIWKNDVAPDTVLEAAPDGAHVLAAMPDGRVLLYDATADTFSVSRRDFETLSGGLAASSLGLYAAGDVLLNDSLVPMQSFPGTGRTTGVAFIDRTALRAGNDQGSGSLARLEVPSCEGPLGTRLVEPPLDLNTGAAAPGAEGPVSVFLRSVAPLANRSAVITLSTSGLMVLPWDFDAAMAPPQITSVVNAADLSPAVAPGSLISVFGTGLGAVTQPGSGLPLSAAVAESCLTVNGMPLPVLYVSPSQINAQLLYSVAGSALLVLRTPGGVSDGFPLNIQAAAPAVFHTGTAGPDTGIATVLRLHNNDLVTNANPIHPQDAIVIYLTGMGQTVPAVEAGVPAPRDPLAWVPALPTVTLGGLPLAVTYAGLAPDQVGVYQINAAVPFRGVPTGFQIPLTVTQGGVATTVAVRVVD